MLHSLCRGRLVVDPPGSGTERLGEWSQFPAWIVGADSIRPWHKAPLRGALCRGDMLVDPYSGAYHSTGYFLKSEAAGGCYPPLRLERIFRCYRSMHDTPSASLCSAAPSEREPRRLRRWREAKSLPYDGRGGNHRLVPSDVPHPLSFAALSSSPNGGAKGTSCRWGNHKQRKGTQWQKRNTSHPPL